MVKINQHNVPIQGILFKLSILPVQFTPLLIINVFMVRFKDSHNLVKVRQRLWCGLIEKMFNSHYTHSVSLSLTLTFYVAYVHTGRFVTATCVQSFIQERIRSDMESKSWNSNRFTYFLITYHTTVNSFYRFQI